MTPFGFILRLAGILVLGLVFGCCTALLIVRRRGQPSAPRGWADPALVLVGIASLVVAFAVLMDLLR
jgi:hypothetical protein